jgi:hypothetical protein
MPGYGLSHTITTRSKLQIQRVENFPIGMSVDKEEIYSLNAAHHKSQLD